MLASIVRGVSRSWNADHHGGAFDQLNAGSYRNISLKRIGIALLLVASGAYLHALFTPSPSTDFAHDSIPPKQHANVPGDNLLSPHLEPPSLPENQEHHEPDHSTAVKHLVIASHSHQNLTWLDKVPSDWVVKRYLSDVRDPDPQDGLALPVNVGREAMAYLTHIIDNYDDLPDYAVYVHGHERAWHQPAPTWTLIRALNLTALDRLNYLSLRCGSQMGCERQPYLDTLNFNLPHEKHIRAFWKAILPDEEPPRYLSFKCCAQHAVTRAAIRTRTRDEWVQIRMVLFSDLSRFNDWFIEDEHERRMQGSWVAGTYFEKYWHVLFGAGHTFCPSVQACVQEHFSNAVICDGDADFSVWHGQRIWQETRCISAFDGQDRDSDTEKAITDFRKNLLDRYRDIQRAAKDRFEADSILKEAGKKAQAAKPP